MRNLKDKRNNTELLNKLIIILVFGFMWSLSEVAIGGALRKIGFHYRSGLLTGIGMGIMGVAFAIYRKPILLAGITFIAVLGKQLAIPLLHLTVLCRANSSIAVMLEGLSLAGVAAVMENRRKNGDMGRMLTGASAALIASAAFYYIGMHVAPCRYLLSFNRPGGLISFLTVEGLIWAVFSAILFPAGFWAGNQVKEYIIDVQIKRPAIYYLSASVLAVGFLIGNAIFVVAGF